MGAIRFPDFLNLNKTIELNYLNNIYIYRKTKLDDATMHFYFCEYLTFKLCLYMFFINNVFLKVPEDVLKRTETVVELKN